MTSVQPDGSAADFFQRRSQALQSYLDRLIVVSRVPGICVALKTEGRLKVFRSGRHAADDESPIAENTRFELGCVSKMLLAVVILDLAECGKLDLDAPIGAFFSALEGDRKGREITVAHLLCQSAGYAGIGSGAANTDENAGDTLMEQILAAPMVFRPGTVVNYELTANLLLQEIIEQVTGRPPTERIDELILEPIGLSFERLAEPSMSAVGHQQDPATLDYLPIRGSFDGWAAAISGKGVAVAEAVALATLLATGRSPVTGEQVLSEWVSSRLVQISIPMPAFIGDRQPYLLPRAFGAGIAMFAPGLYGCDGAGIGQSLTIRFTEGGEFVLAIGVNAAKSRAKSVLTFALLRELGFAPPGRYDSTMSQVLAFDPSQIDGRYLGGDGTETIVSRVGDRVRIQVIADGDTVASVEGVLGPGRRFTLTGDHPVSGLAFYADPATGDPSLQIGLYAYKKS